MITSRAYARSLSILIVFVCILTVVRTQTTPTAPTPPPTPPPPTPPPTTPPPTTPPTLPPPQPDNFCKNHQTAPVPCSSLGLHDTTDDNSETPGVSYYWYTDPLKDETVYIPSTQKDTLTVSDDSVTYFHLDFDYGGDFLLLEAQVAGLNKVDTTIVSNGAALIKKTDDKHFVFFIAQRETEVSVKWTHCCVYPKPTHKKVIPSTHLLCSLAGNVQEEVNITTEFCDEEHDCDEDQEIVKTLEAISYAEIYGKKECSAMTAYCSYECENTPTAAPTAAITSAPTNSTTIAPSTPPPTDAVPTDAVPTTAAPSEAVAVQPSTTNPVISTTVGAVLMLIILAVGLLVLAYINRHTWLKCIFSENKRPNQVDRIFDPSRGERHEMESLRD